MRERRETRHFTRHFTLYSANNVFSIKRCVSLLSFDVIIGVHIFHFLHHLYLPLHSGYSNGVSREFHNCRDPSWRLVRLRHLLGVWHGCHGDCCKGMMVCLTETYCIVVVVVVYRREYSIQESDCPKLTSLLYMCVAKSVSSMIATHSMACSSTRTPAYISSILPKERVSFLKRESRFLINTH